MTQYEIIGGAVKTVAYDDLGNITQKSTAASGIVGGIGSVLGGGKFKNGAVTGAFAYIAGRALVGGAEQQAESEPRDKQYADSGQIKNDANNADGTATPKAHILDGLDEYEGRSYTSYWKDGPHHECVDFAQQASGAPLTRYWRQRAPISPGSAPPRGTWVGTFIDGEFRGQIGAFVGFDKAGNLTLMDQFNSKPIVGLYTYTVKS